MWRKSEYRDQTKRVQFIRSKTIKVSFPMICIPLYLQAKLSFWNYNKFTVTSLSHQTSLMEDKQKTVIVTGCNKGIGYGIVEHLAKCPIMHVIMACRNVDKGNKAKQDIMVEEKEAHLCVEKLDVSDSKSIDDFISMLKQKNTKIDVLINNAGVAAKKDEWSVDALDWTMKTNFYGTIELTQKMLPLMHEHGKIIIMGSCSGRHAFQNMKSQDLKKRFMAQNLTKGQLFQLMKQFRTAVQDNTYEQKGWPKSMYGISKLAINLYAQILGRDQQIMDKGIQVYSECPGYVKTDMTGSKGHIQVGEGVKTTMHLVALPFKIDKAHQGGFFEKCHLSSTFEQVGEPSCN